MRRFVRGGEVERDPLVTIRGVDCEHPDEAAKKGSLFDPVIAALYPDDALLWVVAECIHEGVTGNNRQEHIESVLDMARVAYQEPRPEPVAEIVDGVYKNLPVDALIPAAFVRICFMAEGRSLGPIPMYPRDEIQEYMAEYCSNTFGVDDVHRLHIVFFDADESSWRDLGEDIGTGLADACYNSTFIQDD